MLINHPDINKDDITVRFNSFNNSSLDILINYFTDSIQWQEHMRVKEDVNYKIMEIIEAEGVSFAFPSTSVYIEEMNKLEREKLES